MIHLVRHGDAGRATYDMAEDHLRPLTPMGQQQAIDLVDTLVGDGIDRILSSPALRCVDTIEPLATACGLEVEVEPSLFEGNRADRTIGLVEQLVASGATAVLSSHGDVIPDLLRLLALRGVDLAGPSGCQKAGRWSVDLTPDWLGTATYHAPPITR